MKPWIKTLIKSILIIVAFVVGYIGVMVVAINYFYPYPNYQLDVWERDVEARYFKIVYQKKIDDDTTAYFSRSKNGVGDCLHFGTVDSKAPISLLDNLFCESTSSAYLGLDTLGYVTTSDSSHTKILFGSTLNEITSRVVVRFMNDKGEALQEYEMEYKDQCYFYKGFDSNWASYEYSLTYYDESDGIVLKFYGGPIGEPKLSPSEVGA